MPVGDTGAAEILQNAAAATGNGAISDFKGYKAFALEVAGTFVATVTFEATVDDTNWFAVGLLPQSSATTPVTSATAAGAFGLPIYMSSVSQIRARISAYTSGNVTVRIRKEYH